MSKLLKYTSSYFIALFLLIFSLYTIFNYSSSDLFVEPLINEPLLKNVIWFALIGIILLFIITNFFITPLREYNKYCYITIILYTLIPRLFVFIKLFNLTPVGDFGTYHLVASALSENTITLQRYISIFPHVIGYPTFLSFFYKIFGTYPYVGQVLNIILSVFISILIYKIGKFIDSNKTGFLASLLWSFFPSQILYTSLLCTEYLYTCLFLLAIYTFLKRKKIYFYILVSFICIILNVVRPLGIILIITFSIYDIIFSEKIKLQKIISLVLMIIIYAFSQKIISIGVSNILETQVATKSIGFNLFVGMNYNNKGTWNISDAEEFNKFSQDTSKTANMIQEEFKEKAFYRINQIKKEKLFFKHFKRKHEKMWLTDNEAIQYIKSSYKKDNKIMNYNMEKSLTILSNIYYYISIFSLLLGILFYIKDKQYTLSIPIIIIIGTVLAHMLVEVGGRYHFSCIPLFLIIGAYGIIKLSDNFMLINVFKFSSK